MSYTILLLEDDQGINDLMTHHLKNNNYNVISVFNGEEAIERFSDEVHLAILDVMVPIKDGFEVLEAIRQTSNIPILFLTAMDSEMDKLKALGHGADDYVTKPFSIMEVIYRINALIRRTYHYTETPALDSSKASIIEHKDLHIDTTTYCATLDGEILELSVREFELLTLLASHPGRIYTKKQLYEQVWGECYYDDSNTIMVHISRIREKLSDNPKMPNYIKTIKGLGYRIEQ